MAVQHYLKSIDSALAGLPVLAKVFASGQGLATLLMKAGFARGREDALQVVSRFTSGFSQTDDMFDFVLVGKGKDRADYKLMGLYDLDSWPVYSDMWLKFSNLGAFRQFAEIPSCQHILFACCHDNGYVRMLEKYVHTSAAVVKKVTLVKSFQTGSEFANLPFQSTTMDTAFRSSPLSHGPGPTFGATNFKSEELAAQVNGSPVVSVSHSPPPATYASRAVASQPTAAPPGINPRPLPVFGTLDKNIILINADGHRIDMVLLPRSAAVAEAFNSKTYIGGKRFCNTYQLCGSCSGSCGYLHDSLTAGEKLVMRHVLRRQKCLDRGKCRNPLCFYGHHCACPGGGKKCSFPVAMHGVDVASWREMNTATGGVSTSVGVGC